MKNLSRKKKLFICIILLAIEFAIYLPLRFWVNEIVERRPYTSENEFVKTVDCAKIFDSNPGSSFLITFDIRAEKEGSVMVYQQNGISSRYHFQKYIRVTQEYQTITIEVTPVLVDETNEESYLAFYGEYGSGVIPEVKNISISVLEKN